MLGIVPHQLRGFLAQFRTLPIVGASYDLCTGCSEAVCNLSATVGKVQTLILTIQVLQAYEKNGFDMLLKVFNETKYLETLTGLDKLHDEGEAALEAVDWDDEDDEM